MLNPQLTAIIVHDLKNALGALESELADLAIDPDRDRAKRAHVTCVDLREKMIGFLTLYKASEQGLIARVEAVNPADFLQELIRHHLTTHSRLAISIGHENMPDIAFFDEHLVELALEAALQNAMRFASSRIEINCKKLDDDIVFTIQDDGPGLGIKEDKPSTGLGMALCTAIAAAHRNEIRQGSAELISPAHGGALFTLRLP